MNATSPFIFMKAFGHICDKAIVLNIMDNEITHQILRDC